MALEMVSEEYVAPGFANAGSGTTMAGSQARRPPEPLAEQLGAILAVLVQALAIRVMLALAMVGSFALTWRAFGDLESIWYVGLWNVTIVAPLIWLATRRT